MLVCSLASGSKANATFLQADDTCVLIDCGLSVKELERRLKMVGKDARQINAVFLTHEHRDHISGLVSFCKKYSVPVFVHARVNAKYGFMLEPIKDQVKTFVNSDFYFGSLTISPFLLSHDSECCVGFSFYHMGKKVSIATDTGFVPSAAIDAMRGSDIAFLESNHDQQMLIYGPYNARLKRRIASEEGHMSNKMCASVAVSLAAWGTKRFVLCHLSAQNNTPDKALGTVESALLNAGYSVNLEVASQYMPTKVFAVEDV